MNGNDSNLFRNIAFIIRKNALALKKSSHMYTIKTGTHVPTHKQIMAQSNGPISSIDLNFIINV